MPKRRLDDDADDHMTQSQGTAAQPLQDATADDLANRLCRFGARLPRRHVYKHKALRAKAPPPACM